MRSLAVLRPGRLEVVEVPMPVMDSCSVLVKTLASGICGTDPKIIHGTFKNMDEYPTLLGHEAVGEVVETGRDVEQFKTGDIILLPFVDSGHGGYASAWGAFSEYSVCHDWKAMARKGVGSGTPGFGDYIYTQKTIPVDFDPVSSVMIITLREVLAACRHFGFFAGKSIVVFGAGSVGLAFVRFARILGLGPVIAADVVDEKVDEALRFGADYAFNSAKTDIVSEVRQLCPDGVDYALDAAGVNALVQTGMQLIKDNGRILVYGISPQLSMQLDWTAAPYNWGLDFLQFPIKTTEADVHDQLISWIRLGLIDPADYVSHVFKFDDILEGFDILERRVPAKKIVIDYR
jgi:threonine dehydrogenase-like Zn-dependent dehydrogenase